MLNPIGKNRDVVWQVSDEKRISNVVEEESLDSLDDESDVAVQVLQLPQKCYDH